jgi:arylsulfatase A-like enzyme
MPSFRFLLVTLLSAIGASCAIAAQRNNAAQRDNIAQQVNTAQRPNIVLVFIDDMAWGDLSCFGGEGPETENIDRLASEGIRFEQFYVNAPICSPSRCAITTGQYPQRWRINSYLDNRQQNRRRGIANWLDPEAPTLARALSTSGYVCGHFGKWHLGGQRNVRNAPLITQYGYEESLTNFEGLGARILPLNNAHDGKGPQRYALGSDLLGHGPVIWHHRAYVTQEFTRSAIQFMKAAVHRDQPFYVNVWPDDVHSPHFPPQSLRGDGSAKAVFHGVLDAMDEQLGEMFDFIRNDDKLRDNTIVLLCSDNGGEPRTGNHGPFRGSKATLFEGGVRSPLVVWGPGVLGEGVQGEVNRTSVFAAFDLPPTLLEIAGVGAEAMPDADGEPLVEVLSGESDASRSQPIFFRRPPDRDVIPFYGKGDLPDLAVRAGKWKLLCEYDGSEPQLYDVVADPGESEDVASENASAVSRLVRAVTEWHASMPQDNGPQLAGRE